ncbi:sigma-70 family RNA polymerase sigma factor [Synechococcales cyanobacterium C]|uniref:Sigma-70 family RNA polymerase sigma factor n=1 Tax=Petrachloros mirabilis ULC683 TaxID=2781853 RepID=A0A8K2A8G3_9CYAN|nr:sigma-70 family RNA polymerase sigma factor [Petrachloros mirabilis]NCJ07999.1 sigma-70 family RNA polymerase sigma factor [Petrachloros mirabilis ULC683]
MSLTNDTLEQQLQSLVAQACQCHPDSLERRKRLTQLICLIQESGKLWRDRSPYYEDALQQTWLFFCQNLCESGTGKQYDPKRGSILTWLNHYLKWRLQDYRLAIQQDKKRLISGDEAGKSGGSLIENTLVANPDIPPMLEETQRWVQRDPDGVLHQQHLRHHPHINCQYLILKRLPPGTSWEDLSNELGVPISTLSSFYQRNCVACLRNFAVSQGYV